MMHPIWKWIAVLMLSAVIPLAFLGEVSVQVVLHETIRNLYWHVTMWFAMFLLLIGSVFAGSMYLRSKSIDWDTKAALLTRISLVFGLIGIATGMVWAQFTWGKLWIKDPQLNGAAVTILAYLAYFVLRNSISDPRKKAEISAVYGIFAFVLMVVLVLVLPRLQPVDSLHPGKGGNPSFGKYDLSNAMRMVFYPAILAWTLIGWWIFELSLRLHRIKNALNP